MVRDMVRIRVSDRPMDRDRDRDRIEIRRIEIRRNEKEPDQEPYPTILGCHTIHRLGSAIARGRYS